MEKKENRGGFREGGGRPKKFYGSYRNVVFRCVKGQEDNLRAIVKPILEKINSQNNEQKTV